MSHGIDFNVFAAPGEIKSFHSTYKGYHIYKVVQEKNGRVTYDIYAPSSTQSWDYHTEEKLVIAKAAIDADIENNG